MHGEPPDMEEQAHGGERGSDMWRREGGSHAEERGASAVCAHTQVRYNDQRPRSTQRSKQWSCCLSTWGRARVSGSLTTGGSAWVEVEARGATKRRDNIRAETAAERGFTASTSPPPTTSPPRQPPPPPPDSDSFPLRLAHPSAHAVTLIHPPLNKTPSSSLSTCCHRALTLLTVIHPGWPLQRVHAGSPSGSFLPAGSSSRSSSFSSIILRHRTRTRTHKRMRARAHTHTHTHRHTHTKGAAGSDHQPTDGRRLRVKTRTAVQ